MLVQARDGIMNDKEQKGVLKKETINYKYILGGVTLGKKPTKIIKVSASLILKRKKKIQK